MTNNITINTGTLPNPYRQFTETIPVGGVKKIYYDSNNFVILYTSQDSLLVNFAGSGGATPMWQGMSYKTDYVCPYIELLNTDSENPLTVTIGMGIGNINDNRLSVSGAVNVQANDNQPLPVNQQGYNINNIVAYRYLIPGNTGVASIFNPSTIAASSSMPSIDYTSRAVLLQNMSQSYNITIFATNGFDILPQGTCELSINGCASDNGHLNVSMTGIGGEYVSITYFG